MDIEFHCNGEGDTYKYDITPDGVVAKFITNSGFVGICSGIYNENQKIGNIVFRIGFNVGNTISISESNIVPSLSESEICKVLELFDKTFSKLEDNDAERKMIELVKYSNLACAIDRLTSKKDVNEILEIMKTKESTIKKLHETKITEKEKSKK